jgi:hypothetical protein
VSGVSNQMTEVGRQRSERLFDLPLFASVFCHLTSVNLTPETLKLETKAV